MQAGEQLGPDWTLMKAGTEGCPEIPQWLAGNVPEPGRVGIDPYLHTVSHSPAALKATTMDLLSCTLPRASFTECRLFEQLCNDIRHGNPATCCCCLARFSCVSIQFELMMQCHDIAFMNFRSKTSELSKKSWRRPIRSWCLSWKATSWT